MKHRLFFVVAAILVVVTALGQSPATYRIRGVVADAADSLPLPGAVVSLVIPQADTAYCITDIDGKYFFQTKTRPASVEAAMLGYGISKKVTDKSGEEQDYGVLWMSRETYSIDAAVVNARVKKIIYKGDTVQYNAAAFKVLKGASAGDLVAKMPGMEVTGGSVKFQGEQVDQAYVDGRKVYGEGTASTLENLEASDVISVEVYQEATEGDELIGNVNGKKNWALNFNTFSKLTEHLIAHALASYGVDEEKNFTGDRQQRYGAGLTVNYFSEKWGFSGNVFANNIDRKTNRIEEITESDRLQPGINNRTAADFSASYNGGKFSIAPSYSYEDHTGRQTSWSEKIYFQDGSVGDRVYRDSSFTRNFNSIHTVGLNASYNIRRTRFFFTSSTMFSKGSSHNESSGNGLAGGSLLSDYSSLRDNRNVGFNGTYRLSITSPLGKKTSMLVPVNVFVTRNSGIETMNDSTFVETGYRTLNLSNDNGRSNLKMIVSPRFTYRISRRVDLGVSFDVAYADADNFQTAIDDVTGLINESQTYEYKDRSLKFTPKLHMIYTKSRHRLILNFGNEITLQKYNVPEQWTRKNYFTWVPDIQYQLNNPFSFIQTSRLVLSYKIVPETPGINMLSPVVNNVSANYFTAGNPDLKQSQRHVAGFDFFWMAGEVSGRASVNAQYTHNAIGGNRTLFFDTDTVLDNFGGFVAPAGSSLSTYENLPDMLRVLTNLSVDFPINPIGCVFKTGVSHTFFHEPYFLGTESLFADRHSAKLNLGIDSNFSEYFEFKINSATGFAHTLRSNGQLERLWSEDLQVKATGIMFKEIVRVGAFYNMALYRYPEFETSNRSLHVLNLTLNFFMLKERNLGIGVAVYDLLNSRNAYMSRITSQYMSNSWSGMTGRYYLINLFYKFNYKKSEGRKINDGGFKSKIGQNIEN